jgi:hypothetical protein
VVETLIKKGTTNGSYACRICLKNSSDNYALKKHLFKDHNDNDVRAKYAVTLEEFIGPYYMERFR